MNITVYCGANAGKDGKYETIARELGHYIVSNKHTLVYGGGNIGLMGILADTVLAEGGKAIGIIPEFLMAQEVGHTGLYELIKVPDMSTRKRMMIEKGDVFIALPGGEGTLEEIVEAISWGRLERHHGTCVLFNYNHYYDPLLTMFDKMVMEGFLSEAHRSMIKVIKSVSELEWL